MGRPRSTGIYIRYCPHDQGLGRSALEKGARFNYAEVPEHIHTGFIPNGCILEYEDELYLLYNRSLYLLYKNRSLKCDEPAMTAVCKHRYAWERDGKKATTMLEEAIKEV